ncbi:hypothetical protein GALMADRAFT_147687 [Galerina marginata CBS 339.88]|uniref:Uncharacterized protein n=1 Tax=Galerina marginata (strain CBS 339.88) TaxID=685588 RepID=A0A067SFX5_GALM3|nr:hypothetical protein GALMADRAFT_147687 [Galerina marginata CBS 339.88]
MRLALDTALAPPKKCNKDREGAVWESDLWPTTEILDCKTMNKGVAKAAYLLNDVDLVNLPFVEYQTGVGWLAKNYLEQQLQLCAWQKYGGPTGFQAAKDFAKERKKCRGKKPKKVNGSPAKPSPNKSEYKLARQTNSVLPNSLSVTKSTPSQTTAFPNLPVDCGPSNKPFDVLELSDDDEIDQPPPRKKQKKSHNPIIEIYDVIDISD